VTLIYVGDNYGCVGRCDAKCYNAKDPHCDCICGGMNHGAGKQAAIGNTREHIKEILSKHPEGVAWMNEQLRQGELGL
jgi:hypothetical protein